MRKAVVKLIGILVLAILGSYLIYNYVGEIEVTDAIRFKEEYESKNGKTRVKNGKETSEVMREVTIPKDNVIVYSTVEEIVNKIENKETFVVYFGFSNCPWCRSVIETALKVANDAKVDKIYYVEIRKNDSDEDELRDIYKLDEDGNIYLSHEGDKRYKRLLELLDNVLEPYTYGNIDMTGTSFEGTKRVGAPMFIEISSGVAENAISGLSKLQTSGYQELTEEMKLEMRDSFRCFFEEYVTCKNKTVCVKEIMC